MPEYLTPGVYIEEIERGPRPIEGVATSTAAFIGETERGPTRPRLVTGFNDYLRWFGTVFDPAKFMPHTASGFFENGGKRLYVCRIVGDAATTASRDFGDLHVEATGPGAWGRRIWVKIEDSTTKVPDPASPGTSKPVGVRVKVAYWSEEPPDGVFDPFDEPRRTPRPALPPEDFDDVVIEDEASPDHFMKRVNDNSPLVKLSILDSAASPPQVSREEARLDQDGVDDPNPIGTDDYEGANVEADKRRGLEALKLDEFREVSLVYAPNAPTDVVKKLISHCENQKFRFAVVDSAPNVGNSASLDPRTMIQETQYAAFYYPWIYVPDPRTGVKRKIPPGGHVLGVYARTDIDRGVYKAPANETLGGVIELEYNIDDSTQGQLNPRGVNALRRFPGRGLRIWGARTLSANALWKYVPVRRLFIFIERSIYEGTQWVVFEPNDERLWARVTDTIRLFLRGQWRGGALMGRTEEEAFFITCDRTTMTQDDILNGRLVCEIGIRPVYPAEFVIFRIFQHTAEPQR
ncbi:phage tail sheath family protein [Siccirubricoccus sp. G192]|uniref:phage tail sheath family protein n=1 Tax=Siccirubricoccus sp. G192 TaxID=2849651 RepID=UPI001C2C7C9C|nr:phage tail sheath family protein [Siccirubricoccus sp. G192]MBV1800615.1 phage tail sheath family protein [Siccirubricoccus sp. G192]MBV1800679.1 phage tail sheath family protein [Siccirubricoccus sp. G192]